MMSRQEYLHLKRFTEIYPDFPQGKLEFKDSPDLRIYIEDEILGVEHTQLIRPTHENGLDLKAEEVLEERIVNRAQEIFEKAQYLPIWTNVHFQPHIRLAARQVETIANAIAEFVKQHIPTEGGEILLEGWRFPIDCPQEVECIYLNWWEKATSALWTVSMTGVVPILTFESIKERILEKENRIEKYRDSCDRIWLLLVLDGHSPSGAWELTEEGRSKCYDTQFNRVIIYDYFSAATIDLITG